jgi:hypothetical protein
MRPRTLSPTYTDASERQVNIIMNFVFSENIFHYVCVLCPASAAEVDGVGQITCIWFLAPLIALHLTGGINCCDIKSVEFSASRNNSYSGGQINS